MNLLIAKVTVTPLLIFLASLAGRRWGEAVAGWLVGLPLTSAPALLSLPSSTAPTLPYMPAAGSLIGTAAQAGFCLGYGLNAPFGWPRALLCGAGFLAISAILLQLLQPSHVALFATAVLSLVLTLYPKSGS